MTMHPVLGVLFSLGAAALAGVGVFILMKIAFRRLGHDGYVHETREERAARVYLEHAKQGMSDR